MAQKATELGAGALWPIFTKYTSVSRVNAERLRSNSIEAAEQSGRLTVPKILDPIDFDTLIEKWPHDRDLFCLDEMERRPNFGRFSIIPPASIRFINRPRGRFCKGRA